LRKKRALPSTLSRQKSKGGGPITLALWKKESFKKENKTLSSRGEKKEDDVGCTR